MIMKGRVKRWKSKSTTKRMGYGTSCTGTIISRASWSRPKNSVLSAYGGQRHLRYLRQHRKALYTGLQITGKLNGYLADLNEQAENMFVELVKQMVARENLTEQLKAQNQMLWVQRMNNIRDRAVEVVNNDLIYA